MEPRGGKGRQRDFDSHATVGRRSPRTLQSTTCPTFDLSEVAPGLLTPVVPGPPADRSHIFVFWPASARFFSFFGRPEADQKINDFSTPPKSPQGVKKSTQGRPRVDFSWILRSFWAPFFMFFEIFSKMCKTMKSSCGCSGALI